MPIVCQVQTGAVEGFCGTAPRAQLSFLDPEMCPMIF